MIRLLVLLVLLGALLAVIAGIFIPGDTGWAFIDFGALALVFTATGILLELIDQHAERQDS